MVVPDVTDSPIFHRQASLEVLLDAGVRSVQSTPLSDSEGRVLGVLSTHYRHAKERAKNELRRINYWAHQGARLLEMHRLIAPS